MGVWVGAAQARGLRDDDKEFSQPPGPSPGAPRDEMTPYGVTPHFDSQLHHKRPPPLVGVLEVVGHGLSTQALGGRGI